MELALAEPAKGGRPRGPGRKPTIPGYHSEAEQAERLGISVPQLRRWRRAGIGPRHVYCGRYALYPHGEDEKYLAGQLAAADRKPAVRGRGRPRTA